jgi:hypothetical protein
VVDAVVDLEVFEQVRQLKYRYLRTLDLKQWDEYADTMTADIKADYGKRLSFDSRDAVVGYMREWLTPSIITMHQCHHPEIEVDGDTASGLWYLEDKVLILEQRMMLTGACFYEDEYRRCDDGKWRISRTGYRRTFEAVQSLDPTWKLTANGFAS